MSARGLFPLLVGGGLAYWAYNKKEEEGEEEESAELSVLEELALEVQNSRSAQPSPAEGAPEVMVSDETEVAITDENIKHGPEGRKRLENAKRKRR